MDDFWHLEKENFFEGLEAEKQAFLSLATRRVLKKNEIAFIEGEEGIACFYIESGLVRIYSVSQPGKESTLFLRQAGEVFGLAEVMNRNPRMASAQALRSSVIYTIDQMQFENLLREHFPLVRRVINQLGSRLRYMGKRLSSQNCDVSYRLAFLLVTLAYDHLRQSEDWEKPCAIPDMVSQQQIATMIGSTQPTVSSVLQHFKNEGIISMEGHHLTLINPMKLIFLVSGE